MYFSERCGLSESFSLVLFFVFRSFGFLLAYLYLILCEKI